MYSRICPFLLLLPLFTLASGCEPPPVKTAQVSGQLIKGGSPFVPKDASKKVLPHGPQGIRVVFKRIDGPKAEEFVAVIDQSTGAFEVKGFDTPGVPPGQYTITVYLEVPKPNAGPPKAPPVDQLPIGEPPGGVLGQAATTREVTIPPEGITDLNVEIDDNKAK